MAYEKQNFAPGQKLTAAQLNHIEDGVASAFYYSTERESVGTTHENLNSDYIFGLYDALMAEQPNNVQKKEVTNTDGTFTNYEYVFSTGEYTTEGTFAADDNVKKPKYLILSGIHGDERVAALSLYRFIRDVLNGHNVPPAFKEGVIIHIMPVGNPSGFDAFTRYNDNKVDINRNFYHDGEWVQKWFDDEDEDTVKDDFTNGASAASEKETQVISKWLSENTDAELFVDCHNSGSIKEAVVILGDPDNNSVNVAKKVAMQGVDRIIPYWRDVIGYPSDTIFSYPANVDVDGSAIYYALNTLGIPSLAAEMSVYYGNYSDWIAVDKKAYPPETIAAGAEAIGNILIELYEQSFFGEVIDDMKVIDNKLDILMEAVNSGFRVESGTITITEANIQDYFSNNTLRIPCPNGAKILIFQADSATVADIKEDASNYWTLGIIGNCLAYVGDTTSSYFNNRGYLCRLEPGSSGKYVPNDAGGSCDNTDGFTVKMAALKTGTYNWTAYYWNE